MKSTIYENAENHDRPGRAWRVRADLIASAETPAHLILRIDATNWDGIECGVGYVVARDEFAALRSALLAPEPDGRDWQGMLPDAAPRAELRHASDGVRSDLLARQCLDPDRPGKIIGIGETPEDAPERRQYAAICIPYAEAARIAALLA